MSSKQVNTQIIQSIIRNKNFIMDKVNTLEQELNNVDTQEEFDNIVLQVSKYLKDMEDMNILLNNVLDKPTTTVLFPPTQH
jgi:DNA-binding transcriptional regulator GbsR (MarR family)